MKAVGSRADRAEGLIAQSAGDVFGGFLNAQKEFVKAYLQGFAEDPASIIAGPVGIIRAGARLSRSGIAAEEAIAAELGVARNFGPGRVTVSGSGPGGFRVPDFDPTITLPRFGILVEVKAGFSTLRFTQQLRDLKAFADVNMGVLVIRTNRPLAGELRDLVNAGQIRVVPIP